MTSHRVTRLAPSPTGALHLGNARTFLINWALARQSGDEAKHYRLIADHLQQLGVDLSDFDPLAQGFGPLTASVTSP